MLEMIQILLFGGFFTLTPEPISIDETPLQIVFSKPITAINCSASFNVKISEQITSDSYSEAIKEAKSKFKDGCIKIELQSKGHEAVVIGSDGSLSWEEKTIVPLTSIAGICQQIENITQCSYRHVSH